MRQTAATFKGEPWQCTIKLRREYDATGARLPRVEELHFAHLGAEQRGSIATAIRAAQKALLYPETALEDFKRVVQVWGWGSKCH